jgi:hypothetical protein
MGYMINSQANKLLGAFHTGLSEALTYNPAADLRGRNRGETLFKECQQLLTALTLHSKRCAMVIPQDVTHPEAACQKQLKDWSDELVPMLTRLGHVFFPDEVLDVFRSAGVEHVVLCIDPQLSRIPYSALLSKYGPILDEPWTLSIVTSSTDLARIAERNVERGSKSDVLCWFGPDPEVNADRGGDAELQQIAKLLSTAEFRNENATLEAMLSSLSEGRWCHFRGHGRWTGLVSTSGPVLSNDEVLSTDFYNEIVGSPGFLFTAACLTGFGEGVGVEIFGSLVDYDRPVFLGPYLPIGRSMAKWLRFLLEDSTKSSRMAEMWR